MPITIKNKPNIENNSIVSSSTMNVHTSDKNGVIYARFDIFAVFPYDNANTQARFAKAIVATPLHIIAGN